MGSQGGSPAEGQPWDTNSEATESRFLVVNGLAANTHVLLCKVANVRAAVRPCQLPGVC